MTGLLPQGELQFFDNNGAPLVGGLVSYFVPGTLTYKNTYQDILGTILNTNPVVLDASARATIYGNGSYDMSVTDSLGNLIYAGSTSSSLSESVVSSFMMPVLGAATANTFLNLSGTATYVQAAIAAIQLMPGPAGPTGAASTVPGPAGPTGSAGSYPAPTWSNGNPGYWRDNATGFIHQWGSGTTNSGGILAVNYGLQFGDTSVVPVCITALNPINIVIRVSVFNQFGFSVYTEDTSQNSRPCSFGWMASGF